MTMSENQLLSRITVNPKIFGGQPIIRGLRVKVENVLALLEQEVPMEVILDDYLDLEPQDIRACLAYARASVANTKRGFVLLGRMEEGCYE